MLELGELIALALAVTISPSAIAGVLLLLPTASGIRTATGLVIGWAASLAIAVGLATLGVWLFPQRDAVDEEPEAFAPLLVGVLLMTIGTLQWLRASRAGEDAPEPRWVGVFTRLTPGRAVLLGAALALLRLKNILAVLAAGLVLGLAQHGIGVTAVMIGVFAVVASLSLLSPVLIFGLGGPRMRGGIRLAQEWTMRHVVRIAASVFVLLGAALVLLGVVRLCA